MCIHIYIYDHICMYIQLINEANINKPTEIWGRPHCGINLYLYLYTVTKKHWGIKWKSYGIFVLVRQINIGFTRGWQTVCIMYLTSNMGNIMGYRISITNTMMCWCVWTCYIPCILHNGTIYIIYDKLPANHWILDLETGLCVSWCLSVFFQWELVSCVKISSNIKQGLIAPCELNI